MASPNEKLANSLETLNRVQEVHGRVLPEGSLGRRDKERLVQNGYVIPATAGWMMLSSPEDVGGTVTFYAAYWDLCAKILTERFGTDWCLSPQNSLMLSAEMTNAPPQLVVWSPSGGNNVRQLRDGHTIYDLRKEIAPVLGDARVAERNGLRLLPVEIALASVPEGFFRDHPLETSVALMSMANTSALTGHLIGRGATVVAGRLAGALRHVGREREADRLLSAMRKSGYAVSEKNPFDVPAPVGMDSKGAAPIALRIQGYWNSMRENVLQAFDGIEPVDLSDDAFLGDIDDAYEQDAYNSLSIEGYVVTPELIARVRSGEFLENDKDDDRNALAARGYWDAFQEVKETIATIRSDPSPDAVSEVLRDAHHEWYLSSFGPSIRAGILERHQMAGYRNHPVFLRGSNHTPPRVEAVADGMEALFDCIAGEESSLVSAALGHWLTGYVHPFPDGNGRTARFLMNSLLASGGYPWTIVRTEDRPEYMRSLEAASVDRNIDPFAAMLASRLEHALERARAIENPKPSGGPNRR